MHTQTNEWKLAADRLWSASAFDCHEAAQLAADMARHNDVPSLRDAAAQALPSLRQACAKTSDRATRELAHRRFSGIRDILHALTAPRFGQRRGDNDPLSPDESHRRILDLPAGRRLFGAEIHRAYKRAAKTMHPDVGGSEEAFLELSAAREALMKTI